MHSKIIAAIVTLAVGVANSFATDDSLYISKSAFMYADDQRYTMWGGTPRAQSDLQLWPTVAVGAGFGALMVGLHVYQRNAWWDETNPQFRVIDDSEYARGLDKFGHIYSSYIMSTFSADLMMVCGLSHETSTLVGSGMGVAYTLYVEVLDGYAKEWGFSPTDAIADVVGASFFLAQYHVPFLQNFTPRWSYVPAQWVGDPVSNNRQKIFIDDYNSTTFWLAANVHNLLWGGARDIWPDWLMFSVGYGIRNYDAVDETGAPVGVTRRFLFGLDYNWLRILPPSNVGFVNYLRQALNYIRLPGPTLEVGDEGVKFGIFYPFAIVVPL